MPGRSVWSDEEVSPVLQPATPEEERLFGTKKAMQFLVSLIDFQAPPLAQGFEAIE